MGGAKSLPVVTITDADLEVNGGQYKLVSKYAMKVSGNDTLSPLGGVAMPVYPVSQAQIASGEFELVQGRAVDVSQVSDRGRESSAWAMPVYHEGPGTWPPSSSSGCGDELDSEYCNVESQFSAVPSDTWRDAASDWFVATRAALSISALSEAFDFIYLLCNENANDALINLANPGTFDAVNNGTTFEASRGYSGGGVGNHIATGYIPNVDGVNYLQDSASMGVYCRTDKATSTEVDMGCRHGVSSRWAIILTRTAASGTAAMININSTALGGVVVDGQGLFLSSRTASDLTITYRDGISVLSSATASATRPDLEVYVLANNDNGVVASPSTRQLAMTFVGRGMDAIEQLAFYAATQDFMTAIGAQV